jgi:predicted outer membrane repeat protein
MEGTTSVALLDGSSFISNSAPAGGAIHMFSGCSIPSLNQTSFVNNTAQEGGALYLELSSKLTWEDTCSAVHTVAHASANYAQQAGGFGFFAGEISDPPECILQLATTAKGFGQAGLYGDVFATSPVRISVLSVQGSSYSPNQTIPVHPSQPFSFVASVHDAFRQPCVNNPPLGVDLTPNPSTVKFVGSLQESLDGSGVASFIDSPIQSSSIRLLQGTDHQHFNLTVGTGAQHVENSVVQMKVISCPAG